MWPMPAAMLRLAGRATGLAGEIERLVGDLEIDDSATRELLGWKPAKGMDQVLAETAAWWREQGAAAQSSSKASL
jgi:nucleoside-diphosphate-sugar epimerase